MADARRSDVLGRDNDTEFDCAMTTSSIPHRILSRRRLLGYVVLAGAVGLAGYQWSLRRPDYAGQSLSVAAAHQKAVSGDILLIDIRRPDEWSRTGIGEAAHPIDMRRPDFVAALTQLAGPDPTRPIGLICARGVRSARLGTKLTQAGFTRIIDVPEGMLGSSAGPGWLKAGLPVQAYVEDAG